ncbi:MAG: glycogen/starch/alpha-glucan phosphorylase [Pseudomonadota bacterium]
MDARTTQLADAHVIRQGVERHLKYSMGKDPEHASRYDWRVALSLTLRDRIVDPWFESTRQTYAEQRKRVYYLSMEFLIGRLIQDAVTNLGLEDACREALADLGQDADLLMSEEPDAALGNGGLGRLAACFLDSLSTLGIAAYGYGVRYEHGLFRQSFENGRQVEEAEDWLQQEHPWEFVRPEVSFCIGFGGSTTTSSDGRTTWQPAEFVIAQAYDTPIIGWEGRWANTLRLWAAKPTTIFDLHRFNAGEYAAAAEPEALARTLSRVLYPDDTTEQGKELRLKQEYFFTAASIQDLVARFRREYDDLRLLPERVAIQMNDTHPAIAAPELVRILVDDQGMAMAAAIELAHGCLAYTNHTLLPEALESWSVELFRRVLPRHFEIVQQIEAWARARAGDVSIIEHGVVKMGDLAFLASHRVNGVSALHTELVKRLVFRDLHERHPERIVNVTNGVTPRRWLHACNPSLRSLINDTIGTEWPDQLERLDALAEHADSEEFRHRYGLAKRANKARLARWLEADGGPRIDCDAIFDVHIKRIHEYKRQLLNILETIAQWNAIRAEPTKDWVPRVKIFGGKAAPGYYMAKQIIRLINDVAAVVNNDPVVAGRLMVVYPDNYNVSMAEVVIPASDLSEQISTAGKEASGTGNMKFALNGAPTIGTLDGANIEIRDRVRPENFFLFGLTTDEVIERRQQPGYARAAIEASDRLAHALDQVAAGRFSPEEPGRYRDLVGNLYDYDYFMVTVDFDAYFATQREVDAAYRDQEGWLRAAIMNTARVGWFSSDRAIRQYATEVWGV